MDETVGFEAGEIAAVDRAVEAARKAYGAPGMAVAITRNGNQYLRGYGVRELNSSLAVTSETVFAIASVTKAFTTTAIAMLVDEGKMAWDDPVSKYLPWFRLTDPAADACVTIRDLVCHRSGMPRHDLLWYVPDWNRGEIVRRFCLAPRSTSFRSTYEYTNIPFMAAALALESVAGTTWEKFVARRIFRPLGMSFAGTSVDEAQQLADHATPHEKVRSKLTALPWLNMDAEGPCGGINLSASDIVRWLEFQLGAGEFRGTKLISKKALLETHKPCTVIPVENPDKHGLDFGVSISSYCLGWNLHDFRGHIVMDHGGAIDGFTSSIAMVKREDLGAAVLCNMAGGSPAGAAMRGILDALLGLPKRNWPAMFKAQARNARLEEKDKKAKELEKNPRHLRTRPSLALESYAGDYEDSAYGRLSIACDDGRLTLNYYRFKLPLRHYHFDTFSFKIDQPGYTAEGKAQFLLDANANPTSVRIEGMMTGEFKRVVDKK